MAKQHGTPKRKTACWMDYKTMTYYERDLRNGRLIYVKKFPREDSNAN